MVLANCVRCIDKDGHILPCANAVNPKPAGNISANAMAKQGYITCKVDGQLYLANADRVCLKYRKS